MTHCAMLCRRCAHNTPKGLNAPDPWLPPAAQALVAAQAAAADSEVAAPLLTLAPNDVRDTLHALAGLRTAKLPRRGLGLPAGAEERPFELPADVLHELRSHQITPRGGFGPPAYKEIRRSVYAHGRPREMLPATDVGPCLCSLATGGCDHRCRFSGELVRWRIHEGWSPALRQARLMFRLNACTCSQHSNEP